MDITFDLPSIPFLIPILAALVLLAVLGAVFLIVRRILIANNRLPQVFRKVVLRVTVPRWTQKEEQVQGTTRDKLVHELASTEQIFAQLGSLWPERGLAVLLFGREDHVAFEIVADQDLISFYVAVPSYLRRFLEQHIHAQFPYAHIEAAEDYNIFAPTGATVGAALTLSKPSLFPIKTYKKNEVDFLAALSSVLAKIKEPSGAAIQILARTAHPHWHLKSTKIARAIQQGKTVREALASVGLQGAAKALGDMVWQKKPSPEELERRRTEGPRTLTPMEQEIVKGIEEKNAKSGLDVNIRVLVSADTQENAETLLANIVDTFGQFSVYEYGNGFASRRPPLKKLAHDFIYRIFDERRSFLLTSEELTSLYHFPTSSIETPNIRWLLARAIPAPTNIPTEGLLLGENVARGVITRVHIGEADRRRHMYTIGMTGSGKSNLLAQLAIQDIQAGKGIAVIDPHGSLVEEILPHLPRSRVEDVILFDPSDVERPLGLNMLEAQNPAEADFAVQEMIAIFYKLVTDPAMIGPMFEHNMRNAMLTLMADKDYPGTIAEIPRIFTDPAFQKLKVAKLTDPVVRSFWEKEMAKTSDFHKSEMLGYLISKVGRFVENAMMRNIIGQPRSGFSFREVMDHGKILLVNLSKGKVGEVNSNLLGLIIVSKLQMAALARADLPESQRRDFYLYIDEFQNFITDSVATILAEARKYKLNLILAHQYLGQLVHGGGIEGKSMDTRIRDAIFGNVGTMICFRIGVEDAEVMEKQFAPQITEYDLINIDKFNAYVRLLVDNAPTTSFNMRTFPPKPGDPVVSQTIKELSRLKYGRDRQVVEAELLERSRLGETAPSASPATGAGRNL